ncbi:polynucleotide adenylyltransferase PcnB [Psychrobacter phenylpyruvicus]|uniref:Poly(A) polymerase I n=1 Tax=Psychrobacter phenylpyruvicus TaxID=29432 RepID=A0A379LJ71_9GAMM|nr:polynucleotide adenylyltransferase PcnB [Psychrobacter phenylpyruvicus]SUD89812.1 Poly(A) polymerase precursor [Psychrobacter phenylpyruvicus]
MAERSAKQLGLSKADLPNSIIEVIATLSKAGFEAYIVGGGVRDTLLGLNPKDFDAVTDARPHEVKDLFGKRCRIIGRRFQLAHVYSGRDMIEVATFRAPPPTGNEHTTSDGMIVRDNVWGDIHQDFARRDFSINAMYYEPLKGVVHDFCNALDDIKNKTLRLLGHAPIRIEEDPVRLLRALRFKAKLGFEFDKELSEQFHDDNWALLDQVSPHRLYDESQKMFTGGYLVPLLPLLFEYGAIRHLIIYPPEQPSRLVNQVAINTDKRIALGKSINPAFFYAALLWDNYLHQLAKFKKKNMPFHDAQLQAASKVIDRQRIKTAIPRFAEQFIRDIWVMQPKLANPRVKQIAQLAEHPRFRAAFDFLLLREQCGDELNPLSESTNGMGEWWQTYQTLSEKQKQQAIDSFAGDSRRGASKSSRNRNRSRNRSTDNDQSNSATKANKEATAYSPKPPKQIEASSSTQNKHYAAERAQLEKLSLGKLAGEHSSQKSQPSPLFTINADKMAKQVPQQSDIEKQQLKQAEATQVAAENAQSVTQSESSSTAKPSPKSTAKTSTDKVVSSQLVVKKDVVLLPKAEPIPSQRRRRQPSQKLSYSERMQAAKSEQNATEDQKQSQAITAKTASHSKVDDSQAAKAKQLVASKPEPTVTAAKQGSSATTSPAAVVIADKVIPKSDRVPATRRRREPSSTVSVSEKNTSKKSQS